MHSDFTKNCEFEMLMLINSYIFLFSIQINRKISKILAINYITEAPSGAEVNLLIHFAHLVNLRITISSLNFHFNFQIFELINTNE